MDSVQRTAYEGLKMIAAPKYSGGSDSALLQALPRDRAWRRILVVINGPPDEAACSLAVHLAHRDGASLILYDTSSDSFWASPFPAGEGVRPLLLAEADLRRVGRDELAAMLHDVRADGVDVMAHVSAEGHCEDLARLVAHELVDLVLCPVLLGRKSSHQVQLSRQRGASLLECRPGETPAFHAVLAEGEAVPGEEHVQLRFLGALVLTFFVAVFRNRPHS